MKKILLIMCIGLVQGIGPQSSDEAKAIYFQTERISPENALYYQLGCPLPFCNLGYAYSDNWKRGVKWDLAIVGGTLVAATMDEDGMAGAVGLAAVGLSIFKIFDVYRLAEEYNDNLYKKVFNGQRPYFSVNYSEKSGPLLSMTIPIK